MSFKSSHVPSTKRLRPGQLLPLSSLAPEFEEDKHQFYVDLLGQALQKPSTRNIALTGAYGTGKSSILQELKDEPAGRVVELSLSTIEPEAHDAERTESQTASRTNQIQKEIVKQLLYRLRPAKVPRSKFGRSSVPNASARWWVAAAAGLSIIVVLLGLGIIQPFVHAHLTKTWREYAAYVVLLGVAIVLARAVIALGYGRSTLTASVNAGPAMVNLSPKSETYFDEYLDEIVYFFESSGATTVILEDIDRFDDIQVFDTLRALNGLVNSAEQIKQRVVFIYAIRDSVFDLIGGDADGIDRARSALKRANRTKFFDVIIPVVPFLSANNARDLMAGAMSSTEFTIDRALIRLAARHVADMRLIRNIRNEFEIYRNQLVIPEPRVPGITDDLVFAIVLFKNTYLSDFESIRYRESTLDRLYDDWRKLVAANLKTRSAQLASVKSALDRNRTREVRAKRLTALLEQFRQRLEFAAKVAAPAATVNLAGPLQTGGASDPALWEQIAHGEPQQFVLHDPNAFRSVPLTLSFDASRLARELGVELRWEDWDAVDNAEAEEELRVAEEEVAFLRHHTWEQIVTRPEFRLDAADGKTFDELIDLHLESELARELVRRGYLTSHFALYCSHFYGEYLGVDALEYIRRCIEPGIPDSTFDLDEGAVEQLLADQNAEKDTADLFHDPSVFNVSIVDYLLDQRPRAARIVAQNLARRGTLESEFLDTYLSQGSRPAALLAAMAPYWTGAIQYAAIDANIPDALRAEMLDAVLDSLPTDDVPVSPEVGSVLSANYRDIAAITQPPSTERASVVLSVVQEGGGRFDSVEPLNGPARQAAITLRLFQIDAPNLRALLPDEAIIGLDTVRSDGPLSAFVLDHLADYVHVIDDLPEQFCVVSDPSNFGSVLAWIVQAPQKVLDDIVKRSARQCRVDSLSSVDPRAWTPLVAHDRTLPSFDNVAAYIERHGLDPNLGAFLAAHKNISSADGHSPEERRDLAVNVLCAAGAISSTVTRVRLAAALKPGIIDPSALPALSGDLVARMLKRRLLTDDATAFSPDLMVDWDTLEATITNSKRFPSFVSPDILRPAHVAPFLRSTRISEAAVKPVLVNLGTYVKNASRAQADSIASTLLAIGLKPDPAALSSLLSAGAQTGRILELMLTCGDALTVDDTKELLRQMGADYARVSNGGRGWPTFPPDSAHSFVMNRLRGDTVRSIDTVHLKGMGDRIKVSLQ